MERTVKVNLKTFDKPVFFILFVSMAVIPVLALLAYGMHRAGLPGPLAVANGGN